MRNSWVWYGSVLLSLGVCSGCVTVNGSKVLTIPQTNGPVVVTSTARVKCWDLLLVMYCRLNMEMEASNGQRVSDFPPEG